MTATVTLPDTLVESADRMAEYLGLSRNELYEAALARYLREAAQNTKTLSLREQFDAVYTRDDSSLDPLFGVMQVRSLPEDNW